MTLTVTELAGIFVLLFIAFHILGIWPTVRAVLVFFGVVTLGNAGHIGGAAATIGRWAQDTLGSITAWAIGASLGAGLFILLAVFFIHDLHPKKTAGKRTGWIAIALGVVITAGVVGIPALAGLRGLIVGLMGNITSLVNGA